MTHEHELPPGEPCPTCSRRIPFPKKETSPKTKVVAIRVPWDNVEAWEEILDAAAKHVGLSGKPHHKFHTLNAALVLLLQGPSDVFED